MMVENCYGLLRQGEDIEPSKDDILLSKRINNSFLQRVVYPRGLRRYNERKSSYTLD